MNQERKLELFAEKEFHRNIHNMIIDIDSGYVAFGRYYLEPVTKSTEYKVFSTSSDLIGTFGDKRTAISWCVADKFNQLKLAQEIKNLDRKKQSLTADLHCRKKVADRSRSVDFEEMVLTKLQPKVQQLATVSNELEKCLNSAKYLQLKGFQNETARTSGV